MKTIDRSGTLPTEEVQKLLVSLTAAAEHRAKHTSSPAAIRQFDKLLRGAWPTLRVLVEEDLAGRQRIAELESMCASVYQACGAGGAPARVLDVLDDAANHAPLRHAEILPVLPGEWEAQIARKD